MSKTYRVINEHSSSPLVITVEHGGNDWPDELPAPQFAEGWQEDHTCYDRGMAALAEALAARLQCTALIGNYTRLLVDLNRESDDTELIATHSDGREFPDNKMLTNKARAERITDYYQPYQDKLSAILDRKSASATMLSLHSFTRRLRSQKIDRPWDIGVLYVEPNVFSTHLVAALQTLKTINTGENVPYDLRKVEGGTVHFHAERRGLKNAELEICNDRFLDLQAGVDFWTTILTPILKSYML